MGLETRIGDEEISAYDRHLLKEVLWKIARSSDWYHTLIVYEDAHYRPVDLARLVETGRELGDSLVRDIISELEQVYAFKYDLNIGVVKPISEVWGTQIVIGIKTVVEDFYTTKCGIEVTKSLP
jgi:hypothetical protein